MATTQYIGARYVPLFADPAEWDSTKQYEPLTIVIHNGNSYTSKQYVPVGIEITNDKFWALTGNYNAQVEQYRSEVATFDGRITTNARAIADEVTARMAEDTAIRGIITDEVQARTSGDANLQGQISAETTRATEAEHTNATAISAETTRATEAEHTNATAISAETTRATEAEQANATKIANEGKARTDADTALGTRIDNEVTRAKAAEQLNADAIARVKSAAYLDTTPTVVDSATLVPTSKAVYDFTSKVKEKKTILCFGDSYADNSSRNTSWAYALQDYYGWTVKNYAVSGAGWHVDTRTFYNQLQTAISRDGTDYNIDDIYALVVAGGRNDIMSDGEAKSYVNTFMQAAIAHYKNAKIFVVPMLYDWKALDAAGRIKAYAIGDAASYYGAEVVNYAWEWLHGDKNYIQSDSIHPNAAGTRKVAGYINAALNGCYTPRYVAKTYNWSGAELSFVASCGTVTCNIRGEFSKGPTTNKVFDEVFWPDISYSGVGAVTTAGTPQLFFIGPDGTLNCYNNPSVTGFVGLSMSYPW